MRTYANNRGDSITTFALGEGGCITANGNILASGNLRFRVFNLQLKVINKNFCYFLVYE